MRTQPSEYSQPASSNNDQQKKSVFNRLGRQIEQETKKQKAMKRRSSPMAYGDYRGPPAPPPPQMHEPDYGRGYAVDPHVHAEMEWRYQNERRHMQQQSFSREGRHPSQLGPLPPPPHPAASLGSGGHHYDMDVSSRQAAYYPHPHAYHAGQSGLPPQMTPSSIAMMQQRSSPKYDRHGNVLVGLDDRGQPISAPPPMRFGPVYSHPMSISPPPHAYIAHGGPMLLPSSHDLPPSMRPPKGMYPPQRWPENMEPDFAIPLDTRLADERYSPISTSRRSHRQLPQHPPQLSGPQAANPSGETARYTKWRERRDVITNLDRETAQSSSRTDSLRSSLQQPTNRSRGGHNNQRSKSNQRLDHNPPGGSKTAKQDPQNSQTVKTVVKKPKEPKEPKKPKEPRDDQDISDGEIVDDEDSSDDSEMMEEVKVSEEFVSDTIAYIDPQAKHYPRDYPPVTHLNPSRESRDHFYEPSGKKRRLLEREDYSMDYETISDEDLDDFMGDKKLSTSNTDGGKSDSNQSEDKDKNMSEVGLLNALGIDWANLVEMAKQSKTNNKDSNSPGSARARFAMQNYLPTLGITEDLAGPQIWKLIATVSKA